jgi:hypothetical protein
VSENEASATKVSGCVTPHRHLGDHVANGID